MDKPLISIIMITYNRGRFISEAIDSVLAQSFTAWELLVIDGSSIDDTPAILARYCQRDPRIQYIRLDNEPGIPIKRNLGLERAQGEYIAVLDSDDIWPDPEKLTKQYQYLQEHQKDGLILIGGAVLVIDALGKEIKRYYNPDSDQEIRNMMLWRNPFAHSSVLFSRKAALEAGGYSERYPISEDYDLFLKLGRRGTMANLKEHLLKYRQHQQGVCINDRLGAALTTARLIHEHGPYYPKALRSKVKALVRIFFSIYLMVQDRVLFFLHLSPK
jgi:glycosyltransferase involved in cell wall biosynthesis